MVQRSGVEPGENVVELSSSDVIYQSKLLNFTLFN